MGNSSYTLLNEIFLTASKFLDSAFENVQKKDYEDSKTRIYNEMKQLNNFIPAFFLDSFSALFNNLANIVFTLNSLKITEKDQEWVKTNFKEITQSWMTSSKCISDGNLEEIAEITSKNLKITHQLHSLEIYYLIDNYVQKILANVLDSQQNLSKYFHYLCLLSLSTKIITNDQQNQLKILLKVLSALRIANTKERETLKLLALNISQQIKKAIYPQSSLDTTKEASTKIEQIYEENRSFIDGYVSDYPFNSVSIYEISRIINLFDNILQKDNWPDFFEGPNSFLSIFSEMKEYYSKSSSVFIMFNCLIITLKSYHDYSYKFSSETLGKYLNNFKDMLSKLKEFLIICPNEENPKEELYSNLNQLIADFNQDFRDIISILKQLY